MADITRPEGRFPDWRRIDRVLLAILAIPAALLILDRKSVV